MPANLIGVWWEEERSEARAGHPEWSPASMLPLSTKGDPTVFFLFLKAGLKLLYKNLGYLA